MVLMAIDRLIKLIVLSNCRSCLVICDMLHFVLADFACPNYSSYLLWICTVWHYIIEHLSSWSTIYLTDWGGMEFLMCSRVLDVQTLLVEIIFIASWDHVHCSVRPCSLLVATVFITRWNHVHCLLRPCSLLVATVFIARWDHIHCSLRPYSMLIETIFNASWDHVLC